MTHINDINNELPTQEIKLEIDWFIDRTPDLNILSSSMYFIFILSRVNGMSCFLEIDLYKNLKGLLNFGNVRFIFHYK